MELLKDASPRAGISDIWHYIKQRREHNLVLWTLSCVPIAVVIIMFQMDAIKKNIPPPPTVTYFESWPADRSMEETMAAIKERQAKKDAFLEKKRQDYKSIGRALGIDVEAVEKEAIQKRAAEAKAAEEAKKSADSKANKGAAQ